MKSKGVFWIALATILIIIAVVTFSQLSVSKKRYFKYLSQQLPHLITRYFV